MEPSLQLFEDEDGLLRCKGRIGNAPLPYSSRYPILLTKHHRFSTLVVDESHQNVGHNKTRETLNDVRPEYWIPQGRSLVKKVINHCRLLPCAYPDERQLPKARVDQDHGFNNIVIDYAGPVFKKNPYADNHEVLKAWIALMTCLSSSAVSLDVVTDYSSDAAIQVLERFFCRYGAPKRIVSDNGTNFKANAVQDFVANQKIRWSFNLEAALWLGGVFERLIQSAKRILRKTLRRNTLTYDEFFTLLKKVENILNHRPLTYVYGSEISQPLTPNHLIYGRKIETKITDSAVETTELNCTKVIEALDYFWEQWKQEYLISLRKKNVTKQRQSDRTVNVDDVCVIKEETSRNQWRTGQIEELLHSRDGNVRGAIIKTIKGQLKRPVNKTVVVERDHEPSSEAECNRVTFVPDPMETKID